jgi:hypothetical protein
VYARDGPFHRVHAEVDGRFAFLQEVEARRFDRVVLVCQRWEGARRWREEVYVFENATPREALEALARGGARPVAARRCAIRRYVQSCEDEPLAD